MRVTTQGNAASTYAAVSRTSGRLADLQAQLASQRRITRPSDDPSGTAQALSLRSQTSRDLAWQQAAGDAGARLGTLDTTLQAVVAQLQVAQGLVRQGMSSGTTDAAARGALADQLDAVRTAVLGLANTTDTDGHAVFAGTAATGTAFAPDGAYLGNADPVRRAVGDAASVPVGLAGGAVFGDGTASVFATLQQAGDALRSGDVDGARTALAALDAGLGAVSAANAAVGVAQSTLERTTDAADAARVDTATALSALQDLDLPQMAVTLSSAQLAYNVSLQAAARTSQTSLLDFLR